VNCKALSDDAGNVLIEVVAFSVLGFGLVLSLGLQLLEQEQKVLELQMISRNAMRSYLLDPSGDIFEEVLDQQSKSKLWKHEKIDIDVSCSPDDCAAPMTLVRLALSDLSLSATAFGVNSD
jgi:hypothetical protein